jgi:tripartite-type tricarboxylate transporter receptor subunit TctC
VPHPSRRAVCAGLASMSAVGAARAQQSVEDFYKGRTITMIVYSGAGSTYDAYARLLIRHMGEYIPGKPGFVVQNMVGAGGLKALDYLNRIAPKDGSVIGTVSRGLPFEPMLGKTDVVFDPLAINWLGSMNREVALALSWGTSKVKTFEDLTHTELLVPGTGAGADSEILSRAFNNLAGAKFKIISGYRDTSEASLQLERGELDGIAYWSWSSIMSTHPDWIRDHKVNLLFQTGRREYPGYPDVPSILDRARDPVDREALAFLLAREPLGRPFLAPPGVPAARVAALQSAFESALRDPEFAADAKRSGIEFDLVTAAEVRELLERSAAASPEVIARVKKILDR